MHDTGMTLEKAIIDFDRLEWNLALFTPVDINRFTTGMTIMFYDLDDLADDEDEPLEARKKGYKYILTVSEFQSVLENLALQVNDSDLQLKIKALNYYLDNDAFINL